MTSLSPEIALPPEVERRRQEANREAVERLWSARPVLVDIRPASEVVPGLTRETILTSGAPLAWGDYYGGQRAGIIGAALFEGLADDAEEASQKIGRGEISVAPCMDYGCIGSLAGIYTASMPVLVVENDATGGRAFCNLFEGTSPHRLNYGVYNDEVRRNLEHLAEKIAPVLGEAVRRVGRIDLRSIMKRALHMGDELHSRNTAATLLLTRELFAGLLDLAGESPEAVGEVLDYLKSSDYFFLRLSMASSKATADAVSGIEGSSVVSAMCFSCREFAIRVGGLGEDWFRGPLPTLRSAKFFEGFDADDIEFMGGESVINETVGLGGFAQAAAFPLQDYQGGSAEHMVEANLAMYDIAVGEHPDFQIPVLGFRGVPTGIDVFKVLETGTTPVLDIGVAGSAGGQIGAGSFAAPVECFQAAATAYAARYA